MRSTIASTRFGFPASGAAVLLLAVGALTARAEESPYASWGKELYLGHCASCHGATGDGKGPAAASLKTAPADLTLISADHGGKFPRAAVAKLISGDFPAGVHGSREMPVWGQVFRREQAHPWRESAVHVQIDALTDYIESIQRKK